MITGEEMDYIVKNSIANFAVKFGEGLFQKILNILENKLKYCDMDHIRGIIDVLSEFLINLDNRIVSQY